MRLAAVIMAGGLVSFAIGSASAATMVDTATLTLTTVPTGGLSATLAIDKFNVSNATVTGISIDFAGTVSGTISLTATSSGTYAARLGDDFTLKLGGTTLATLSNVLSTNWSNSYSVGQTRNSGTLTGNGSVTSSVSSALFSQFTGTGSLSLALQILQDNRRSGPTPWQVNYMNKASVALQVTYTYTLNPGGGRVPEPMSLVLFGIGLLGLVGAGRYLRLG